ncbi:hypothetical protein ACFVH6_25580 [Spirillospora sp. NPDC127200]
MSTLEVASPVLTGTPVSMAEMVSRFVNDGADMILGELDLGDRDNDLINLVVNATCFLAENGEGHFSDMVRANYDIEPDEIRGWWDW